jgi:hypothetical protein
MRPIILSFLWLCRMLSNVSLVFLLLDIFSYLYIRVFVSSRVCGVLVVEGPLMMAH